MALHHKHLHAYDAKLYYFMFCMRVIYVGSICMLQICHKDIVISRSLMLFWILQLSICFKFRTSLSLIFQNVRAGILTSRFMVCNSGLIIISTCFFVPFPYLLICSIRFSILSYLASTNTCLNAITGSFIYYVICMLSFCA